MSHTPAWTPGCRGAAKAPPPPPTKEGKQAGRGPIDFPSPIMYTVYSSGFRRKNPFKRWLMKGKMTPMVWLLLLTVIIGVGEVLAVAVRVITSAP